MNPWTRGAASPPAALCAVFLAAAALAAGCAGDTDRGARPAADVTAVRTVDPGTVPGVTTVVRSEPAGSRRLYAAYPRVPGADALTRRLGAAVEEQIRPFAARAASAAEPPGGGVPELNVEWSLTAASRGVVGVRLVTWQFLGGSGGESRRTLWYDGATRTAHDSADLVAGRAGLAGLAARVRERLGSRADPALVRAEARSFPSLAFNDAGDLVVEFSDFTVAPGSTGRVAVALGRDAYDPLLSPFGRRARDAALAPAGPDPGRPAATALAARTATRRVHCARVKCIALTFDDGPGPGTRRLLAELTARQARATFFVVGDNAAADPGTLRATAAAGNEIGNHTQGHRDLTRMPVLQINSDVQRTEDVLRAVLGRCSHLLRPPYGATNSTVAGVAKSLGMVQVLWSADPRDWREGSADAVADRVVGTARPGAVVLLHEGHRPTVDAVPAILRRLAAQGYAFVTVSELMASGAVAAGAEFTGS